MALLRNVTGVDGEPTNPTSGGNRVVTSRQGMGVYISGNTSKPFELYNSALIGDSIAGLGLDDEQPIVIIIGIQLFLVT